VGMTSPAFSLGAESSATDGSFQRQDSAFREWVPETAPGRHHLYVSYACPWAHRTLIVRALRGLEDVVGVSVVDPYRDARGWAFSGGEYVDDVNGFQFIAQAYEATDPAFGGRWSVPVLWDREAGRIVNNESAEIIRMLNAWGTAGEDLEPADLRADMDEIDQIVYENVNNGVYRAGFASSQEAYAVAFDGLFRTLDELDRRLAQQRYLAGDRLTLSDIRLFTTLVRFDAVYHTHFKCNGHRLIEYAALWPYARELYQLPGVAHTVRLDEIKRHYYTTHDMLNPARIVPLGPLDMDWSEPHGRG
jgi:glutathionyl-hydroquinone reductase